MKKLILAVSTLMFASPAFAMLNSFNVNCAWETGDRAINVEVDTETHSIFFEAVYNNGRNISTEGGDSNTSEPFTNTLLGNYSEQYSEEHNRTTYSLSYLSSQATPGIAFVTIGFDEDDEPKLVAALFSGVSSQSYGMDCRLTVAGE